MILTINRYSKAIAASFYLLFYLQWVLMPVTALAAGAGRIVYNRNADKPATKPNHLFSKAVPAINISPLAVKTEGALNAVKKDFSGGPTQPEMQAFSSVNSNNMVDLFSGDFSYNIPLLDVGGYPVNLSYRGGISMDQDASWVGLGWNVNPGTITRNMRGLPDDFDGRYDSVRKTMNVKENKTVGVTGGADLEVVGVPIGVGASVGIFNNTYKGWGVENSINASINSGTSSKGSLSGGLSITNNSQEGLTISPSITGKIASAESDENSGTVGSLSMALPYNSRSGMKGLQLDAGLKQYNTDDKNQQHTFGSSFSTSISFASPAFTPTISLPYTSRQFSFTAKVGLEIKVFHPDFYLSGYVSKQKIDPEDSTLQLPAFGYMHFQDGAANESALTDFNREKEIPYREKPAVPHIAVPTYTYDAFSITGEGTGGMFRAYRGDIGFIHDPFMRTKDASDRLSVDVGLTDLSHIGVDLNVTRAFTQSGAWLTNNPMSNILKFRKSNLAYESVYFRNPGEKSVNDKQFYETMGGDDVVAVKLFQPGVSSSAIQTTNYLTRYHDKRDIGKILLTQQNTVKAQRDKRTQVISYMTAAEADVAGLSKYIENYHTNTFRIAACNEVPTNLDGNGTGLPGIYYLKSNLSGTHYQRIDPVVNFDWGKAAPSFTGLQGGFPEDNFSIHWEGRLKAPKTGTYVISLESDDGVRLWINDSLIKNHWDEHPNVTDTSHLNFIAGEFYKIKLEYFEAGEKAVIKLLWTPPGETKSTIIPQGYLYPPAIDTFSLDDMVKEKRLNSFRKANHLSEIDVLNNDGRRYVYGIPVYNLKQEEATFAVDPSREIKTKGIVAYTDGTDNTTKNVQGKDNYFNREDVPAYAHSFLLTGILSPDYVDATGNGITDDDLGDAVKFNYTKICGLGNPYKWRVPNADTVSPDTKSWASLSEGLKTYNRDDKGNYVYGEKELWYLHSISSKTMIATFTLEDRLDLLPMDRGGHKISTNPAKRLKEINLYSKAEFAQHPTTAKPIKTVHFEYSYLLCKGVNRGVSDSGKLTLKKVWFTYNDNKKGQLNPYKFHYSSLNPSYNTRAYDRWGNYKDPLQNPGSTTSHFIGNDDYPYALQDSSIAAINARAWTLDSIYLPSGGSMKVDLESDDYAFVQNKRAGQHFKMLGLGKEPNMTSGYSNKLYTSADENLYAYIKVSSAVTNVKDVYQKYLKDLKKIYFRLSVAMPGDIYGSGNEAVPCYADFDSTNGYGYSAANIIWVKLSGISLKGDGPGSYSPLAKAATQFLRLNLPGQAYPGSEIGDNLDLGAAVKMIFAQATNVIDAFNSFDRIARNHDWASEIDTGRSWVRLNNPDYKKYGGGHRVKRITIYDNWDKMTQQRGAVYGQEYSYTTQKEINGQIKLISSGVASYEPSIGSDENPFHVPIEYVEKIAPLGPVTLGYTEEPLAESLFPAAGVGYSKVRVRTINYKNTKSANGFSETQFYTAYDFPVYTDRSLLDDDTKKRFKPALANLLRVNARHHVVLSQGFKIELNDMHGKLRSEASFSETDPNNPTTYTENFYKVEDPRAESKRLSNIAMVIKPDGSIDSTAIIGKDAELMVDMREQQSITNAYNVNINLEMFTVPSPLPPFFLIPGLLGLAQREENIYRSAAITKVIQRYGVIDSVLHINKGSKVSTKDLVYDSETGDAIVTRTQNEFNDQVYSLSFPSHWAYDGMGLGYKNIGTILNNVDIKNGRIINGLTVADTALFSGGDELIVAGQQKTGRGAAVCADTVSTFPVAIKIWAVDSSMITNGPKAIYFMNSDGVPYTGRNVSLKIVRSGRRNMLEAVGAITTLDSVIRRNSAGIYQLVLNNDSKVINASAGEFKQFWKVDDRKRKFTNVTCYPDTTTLCNDTIPAVLQDSTVTICFAAHRNEVYNNYKTLIHSTIGSPSGNEISVEPEFWQNGINLVGRNLYDGRLNNTGIWTCGGCIGSNCNPTQQWLGFSQAVYIPVSDTMFIGMAGDNQVRVTIDRTDTISRLQDPDHRMTDANPFHRWELFPKYFTAGYHEIKIEGWNYEVDASFGAEIYNLTRSQLLSVDSNTVKAHTLFSTANAVNRTYTAGLSCPLDYDLDTSGGHSYCIKTIPCAQHCDTIIASSCRSVVTDTVFNPYVAGVLGNWRAHKAYTYFGDRTESNPSTATNVRTNGTFADFTSFWNFQSGKLLTTYDTSRWIWNTEKTLFNRKGMEVENKDPLGRYNAGLYGYNLTMPTAVIQNAHYRESAFDGFEDYGFVTQVCDTGCTAPRHTDFGNYRDKLTTAVSHTGLYSLKLGSEEQASLGFSLISSADDSLAASIAVTTQTDGCPGTGAMLKDLKTTRRILLPVFSPFKGTRMLLSAWVKEDRQCQCVSYDSNRIVVAFTGSDNQSITFRPTGNIIEGWQRYESFFDIPSGDTSITVSLQATGTASVYFDDIRVHPFNANMKSFVYNPVNLRLMAELDENNYATVYEYDDDGTLIRLKKETERGIKTIKETRSALLKQ